MTIKPRNRVHDQTLLREANLSGVLYCLQAGQALSRSGLASRMTLNKTTVSSLVDELIAGNLIHEIGLDTSGGGRPAMLLALNPEAGAIIGVELNVDFISVILTDFVGNILWRRSEAITPTDPQETILSQTLTLVEQAMAHNTSMVQPLLGIGLTVPGLVDIDQGLLIFSPNLQWRDVALGQIFSNHTGLPVLIENDANAAALGEHLFGGARQVQDFIFLTVGIGIGGGLFLNGDLYRGGRGLAGEVGHTNVTDGNRPCRCGNRGCWETIGNQYSLIERVRALLEIGHKSIISELMERYETEITLSIIAQAAEADDPVALEAISETGTAIGMGVVNLLKIFNPEQVILGGPLSVVGRYLLPVIHQVIAHRAIVEDQPLGQVVLSSFGPTAPVIGAASLVVGNILSHPSRLQPKMT